MATVRWCQAGWTSARAVLEARPDVAVVFGRRRERYRDQTVYNRLADLEWDTADRRGQSLWWRCHDPHGGVPPCRWLQPVDYCRRGRRALPANPRPGVESPAHRRRDDPARHGDDPVHAMVEACHTLRARLRRRCGTATAAPQSAISSARCAARSFWGLLLPLLIFGLAWPTRGASLALLCGYPILFWRTERFCRLVRSWSAADARLYAAFCVIAKFPHVVGVVKYWSRRIRGKPAQIIEYRGTADVAAVPRLELNPSTYDGTH